LAGTSNSSLRTVADPGPGEFAVQGEELQPGQQVHGQGEQGVPGLVEGELERWQPGEGERFRLSDAGLGVGMNAVSGVQPLQLPPDRVRGDRGAAEAGGDLAGLEVLPVLRVHRLAGHDDARAGGPAREIGQAGDLYQGGVLAGFPVGVKRGLPRVFGDLVLQSHFVI
jgi:hypothetical protein